MFGFLAGLDSRGVAVPTWLVVGGGAVSGAVGDWNHGKAQSSDIKASRQRPVAGNLWILQYPVLGRPSSAWAGGSSAAVQRAQVRRQAERSADRDRNSQSCGEV